MAEETTLTLPAPPARSQQEGGQTRSGKTIPLPPPLAEGEESSVEVPVAVRVQEVPPEASLDDPSLYFNRELSWVDFNWRVYAQAMDESIPLLERVRFLAIAANNLDEFYQKRIGGLKKVIASGSRKLSPDGRSPAEQLRVVGEAARSLQLDLSAYWQDVLRPDLEAVGVTIRSYDSLSVGDKATLDRYFEEELFPILTPLAVDPGHPFPFISNRSLSLAFTLRHPVRGTENFARLKIPTSQGRWVQVPDEPLHFVPIEEVILNNADALFRGMEVVSGYVFRVTRSASVDRNEEEADDLLAMISEELRERRFAEAVRLEVQEDMSDRTREMIRKELGLAESEVIQVSSLLDLAGTDTLADLDLPAHRYPAWEPVVPLRLRHLGELADDQADIFTVIRERDLLVHHPFESFVASTQQFIDTAADDPSVLAIKTTLYRTSEDSPTSRALMRAVEQGKQVAALVELKARFDEENNIEWGRQLESAGVHVAYGLVGLKTHCKATLVVRSEPDGLRTYCHLGTGNYNPRTAGIYTDFGLLTARPEIGADLVNLFHFLTGYSPEQEYSTLFVAPRGLRPGFMRLIQREIEHQRATGDGRIVAKMNGLDDVEIIKELYRASQEGVRIDLIVRGHSRLRPGVPGISKNIHVRSIIGRFLEHSRIYYFHNAGDPELFIGSSDWMRRNLEDRVEIVLPVKDEKAKKRLIRTLRFALMDNRLSWDLGPDGRYHWRRPADGEKTRSLHDVLMYRARRRLEKDDEVWAVA